MMNGYRRDLNKITNVASFLLVFELILLDVDVLHLVIEPINKIIIAMKYSEIFKMTCSAA